MSLITLDIDTQIISILLGDDSRSNTRILRKMYYSLGTHSLFLHQLRMRYFSVQFAIHKVNSLNEMIAQICKKKKITQYNEYKTFHKLLGKKSIGFENTNNKARTIVSFLSLYHGYHYEYTNTTFRENIGYTYYDCKLDLTQPHTFAELRKHRVHNPIYYNKTEDGKYVLNPEACVYKRGATTERQDIVCKKVIP